MALALLGTVFPITALRTRLTTDHALHVQKTKYLNIRFGITASVGNEEMFVIKEDQGDLVSLV